MAQKNGNDTSDDPLIVVTRPQAEAETLALKLKALGYRPLVEPLLEIVPLAVSLPPLEPYRALVFTSANGVRAFADLSAVRHLPVYAVGGATSAALRLAGFALIHEADGDAAALAEMIGKSIPAYTSILHLSGTVVAQDIAPLLAGRNIVVDRASLYEARPVTTLSPFLIEALYACTVKGVLLFSARTARVFATLLVEHGLMEVAGSISVYCLSSAVAAKIAHIPWKHIGIAAKPTSESLLTQLPPQDRLTDGQ
jgi:uroporphyrinogen-III synthase